MFKDNAIFASFAVRDTAAAKAFYGDKIGLDVRDAPEGGLIEIHGAGGTAVTIYPKPDHQPAVFTVLNIVVPDIDAAVDALAAAGVSFEHYDQPELQTDTKGIARGIASGNGPSIAWFKDPDGNIVSVVQTAR